jgi:hypothetical protein
VGRRARGVRHFGTGRRGIALRARPPSRHTREVSPSHPRRPPRTDRLELAFVPGDGSMLIAIVLQPRFLNHPRRAAASRTPQQALSPAAPTRLRLQEDNRA